MYQDGEYLLHNPEWHVDNSEWKAMQIHRLLSRNGIRPAEICEVGCGAGEVLLALHREYPESEAYGFDISPQALDICASKNVDKVHFELGDPTKEGHVYDVALAIDVMEHVEDYIGFARSLKDIGRNVVFHVPLDVSVQSIVRASPLDEARRTVGHLHFFTRETALASIEHAGYEIVDWFHTRNQLESPNRGMRQKMVAWPRRLAMAVNEALAVRFLGGCSLIVLAR
jgi:SAM-dependent methyltransferase